MRSSLFLIFLLISVSFPSAISQSDSIEEIFGIPAIDNLFDPYSPDYVFRDTFTTLSFAIICIVSLWIVWAGKGDRPTWMAVTFAVILSLILWLTLKPLIVGSLELLQRTILNLNIPDKPVAPTLPSILIPVFLKLRSKKHNQFKTP